MQDEFLSVKIWHREVCHKSILGGLVFLPDGLLLAGLCQSPGPLERHDALPQGVAGVAGEGGQVLRPGDGDLALERQREASQHQAGGGNLARRKLEEDVPLHQGQLAQKLQDTVVV